MQIVFGLLFLSEVYVYAKVVLRAGLSFYCVLTLQVHKSQLIPLDIQQP